jgi:hypothetical protein
MDAERLFKSLLLFRRQRLEVYCSSQPRIPRPAGLCCGAKGRAPFGFGQEWLSRAISSGRRLKFLLLTPNSTLRWSALAIRRLNRMEQSIARQNLATRLIAANNFFVHAFVIRLTLFLL